MTEPQSIPSGTALIEANRRFAAATVQVTHLDLVRRRQHVLPPQQAYRVDLCVTQRHASRMRFERWASNRFERPGRLFVVPPGETLAVWNDLGRETVVVCYLYADVMSRWLEERVEAHLLDLSTDIRSDAMRRSMLRLREEVCHPGFGSEVMIDALALQLGVELQRHYRAGSVPRKSCALAAWRLRRIEERIRHCDEPVGLSELASLCSLSVRQLSRSFRESQGLSLGQYIARIRIEKAKQALAGERSIKQLAGQLGFCSTAAFSHAFRKATGLTPSDFRKQAASRR